MINIRKSNERGMADFGWLQSRHTFSFGSYFDKRFMGFRTLRVINEDSVQPEKGFGTHPHEDMEIISYVVSGALEHKDSMGNGSVVRPDDVQLLSAGTGITHSEYNHSDLDPVHFLQIWIAPEQKGLKPGYAQKHVSPKPGLELLGSRDGRDESLTIRQDADLYRGMLETGDSTSFKPAMGHGVWLQVVKGSLEVNGRTIETGDGLSAEDEKTLDISAATDSEFLLFELGEWAPRGP